jgi:hypothetical protein
MSALALQLATKIIELEDARATLDKLETEVEALRREAMKEVHMLIMADASPDDSVA